MGKRRRNLSPGFHFTSSWHCYLYSLPRAVTPWQSRRQDPAIQAESAAFTDLTADMPLLPCANYLSDKGIFSGFPDGSFRPAESLTRAQAARIMDLAGSIPDF